MKIRSRETGTGVGLTPPPHLTINPRPRIRPIALETASIVSPRTASPSSDPDVATRQVASADQRGNYCGNTGGVRKAVKDENGKWQPTGDYEVGFGRPPVASRFSGKPGPGRPKGLVSYDGLVTKHLGKKRRVRIEGREKSITQAELIVMKTVNDAVEGKNRDARKQVFIDMARVMPAETREALRSPQDYNEADRLTLEEFHREVRAEILAELGLDSVSPASPASDAGEGS